LPHDELYRRVREYLEKISSNAGQRRVRWSGAAPSSGAS
jgi:hypothetical protein